VGVTQTTGEQQMTTQDLTAGQVLMNEIAAYLNEIILSTGKKIDINNHQLWNTYLHSWSNEDWADMLSEFDAMCDLRPDLVKPWHTAALETAVMILHKNNMTAGKDRILDTKANKRYAWKMIMAMRELSNAYNGIDVPNEDMPLRKHILNQQARMFDQLFTADQVQN
jgi:hypothetical protein